jgi:hypothetical protein
MLVKSSGRFSANLCYKYHLLGYLRYLGHFRICNLRVSICPIVGAPSFERFLLVRWVSTNLGRWRRGAQPHASHRKSRHFRTKQPSSPRIIHIPFTITRISPPIARAFHAPRAGSRKPEAQTPA